MQRRARRSRRSAADRAVREPLPDVGLPVDDGTIVIRRFVPGDAPAIVEACRDPLIRRWTFMPAQADEVAVQQWLERVDAAQHAGTGMRLAIAGVDDAFLGQIGIGRFHPERQSGEIFYWVVAPARRRGVATRAVRLFARWAFAHLGLERIEIVVDPANEASQDVAEAAGFTREGVLRSYQPFKGGRMDAVMFSLLPGDPSDGEAPAQGSAR